MGKKYIYSLLLERVEKGEVFTLCPSLAPFIGAGFVLSRDFPEIHSQKPKDIGLGPWFPVNAKGMIQRKLILEQAIIKVNFNH
jgi:hypothetical protein